MVSSSLTDWYAALALIVTSAGTYPRRQIGSRVLVVHDEGSGFSVTQADLEQKSTLPWTTTLGTAPTVENVVLERVEGSAFSLQWSREFDDGSGVSVPQMSSVIDSTTKFVWAAKSTSDAMAYHGSTKSTFDVVLSPASSGDNSGSGDTPDASSGDGEVPETNSSGGDTSDGEDEGESSTGGSAEGSASGGSSTEGHPQAYDHSASLGDAVLLEWSINVRP